MLKSRKKILFSTILILVVFSGKLTGAFITNSLALFSDSWHLLTDLVALVISWWGLKATEKLATPRYTFGYYRFSILTALTNNILLVIISIFILYKAFIRFLNPVEVKPEGMIIFAVVGLIVNSIIVFNLRKNLSNMNVKSVFLHFMGDTLGDIGMFTGGIIIYFTGLSGIDTLLSAILACLILRSAIKMALECTKILLEAAPKDIPIDDLKQSIKQIDKVTDVTDIHVWSLSKETPALTAHVCVAERDLKKCEEILHKIQHLLKDKYNIAHSTIQFEHEKCSSCFHSKPDHEQECGMCIDCTYLLKNKYFN